MLASYFQSLKTEQIKTAKMSYRQGYYCHQLTGELIFMRRNTFSSDPDGPRPIAPRALWLFSELESEPPMRAGT
jgi:hypothetical protein